MNNIKNKIAQGVLEYAVLIAAVAAAFVGMRVYLQRAVQTNLKSVQNQISARPIR